jgi:hypothetical protein
MRGRPCFWLGRILIDVGIGRPVAIKPARGAHAESLASFVSIVTAMPFERDRQSPLASFGALNLSSPALSFLPRKSRTFLESASSLQATIGLMILAASAIDGKRSARTAEHR